MILSSLQKSPEKMIPLAMAFITVGLALLTIGINWPRLLFSAMHVAPGSSEFVRSVVYGLAISLEISGLVIAVSAAKIRAKNL